VPRTSCAVDFTAIYTASLDAQDRTRGAIVIESKGDGEVTINGHEPQPLPLALEPEARD
jgi:hypothetical protein